MDEKAKSATGCSGHGADIAYNGMGCKIPFNLSIRDNF